MKSFIVLPTLFFLYGTPNQGPYIHIDNQNPEHYYQKPQNVEISLDSRVDCSKSEFLFQDIPMIFKTNQSLLSLKEEGRNILKYSLVDFDGNMIEKGEKVLILDTKEPEVECFVEDIKLEKTIGVIHQQKVLFQIKEEYIQNVELWIDGKKELETKESSFQWILTKENQNLQCIVTDKAGHVTKKQYDVQVVSPISIKTSILDQGYTLPMQHSVTVSSSDLIDWLWVKEIQGEQTKEPLDNNFFHQNVNQDEKWMCVHKIYPYLKGMIDGQTVRDIKVITQPLSVKIHDPIYNENHQWILPLEYDPNIAKDGKVIFRFQDKIIEKELAHIYDISQLGVDNMEISVQLEDIFHRKVEYVQEVQWDQTGPSYQIKINGKSVSSSSFLFSKVPRIEMIYNEPVYESIQYAINGKYRIFSSIQDALQSLGVSETLVCTIHLEDAYQNERQFQLHFTRIVAQLDKESPKKVERTFEENIGYKKTDQRQMIRTYILDDQKKLKIENKKEEIKDNTKPRIQILQNLKPLQKIIEKKDVIRICLLDSNTYSNDTFQVLRINQEQIDSKYIKKDALGRRYYEFIVKEHQYEIEIIAKDVSGNTVKMTKTLVIKNNEGIFFISISGIVLAVLILYCIYKRAHE